MDNEQFRKLIQKIHQQMVVLHEHMMQLSPSLQKQVTEELDEIAADLGNLQLVYEKMQTSLEVAEVISEELLQQNQQFITERQHYYDLFQFAPDAYFVTDVNGVIIEANQAIATLLNVPQHYLIRKPLAVFVAQQDRSAFRTWLHHLAQSDRVQNWEIRLCPRKDEPFAAQLKVAVVRDDSGCIEALRIGVQAISRYKQAIALQENAIAETAGAIAPVPQVDGLQVLIVDNEVDVREFITAVLEAQGIRVTAVATVAEALQVLQQFRPDVLVSDIRMPDENGYSLIRKVRELEAEKGWHIPAAAFTAYLAEDREKALSAGFESHLHKLAQPAELIELVAQLAGRA